MYFSGSHFMRLSNVDCDSDHHKTTPYFYQTWAIKASSKLPQIGQFGEIKLEKLSVFCLISLISVQSEKIVALYFCVKDELVKITFVTEIEIKFKPRS